MQQRYCLIIIDNTFLGGTYLLFTIDGEQITDLPKNRKRDFTRWRTQLSDLEFLKIKMNLLIELMATMSTHRVGFLVLIGEAPFLSRFTTLATKMKLMLLSFWINIISCYD